jgi:hypothetical protein
MALRKKLSYSVLWVIISVVLSSCTIFFPGSDSPTLIPAEYIPTAIALTSQALISQSSSPTPVATLEIIEPTTTQTTEIEAEAPISEIQETPEPIIVPPAQIGTNTPLPPPNIPFAPIQILNPGTLSRVISPIKLHAFMIPGDGGRARVELYGEDGRLMYRKLFIFSSPTGAQANLVTDIDFEIKGVAETATLVISTDDWYGRIKTLSSEDLILLSVGDSDINPPGDHLAPIVFQEPTPNILIQGGTFIVSGLVRTATDLPLLIELITTDGKVIGNKLAGITPGQAGQHRTFAAEINYKVDSPTWVRVTASEWNKWLTGKATLTSVEVLLSP